MHVLYIHIYIRMCVDGCGWVDFSRVCECVKGMHAERVKENLSVCSAGGHLELLHDEAIHQSKQPWVNLGQHVLGVSYHPAALVITLRG